MKAVDEVRQHLSRYVSLPPGYSEKRLGIAHRIDEHVNDWAFCVRGNIPELRNVVRWKRNTVGRILSFSACFHCGDRWNWKRNHPISTSLDRADGMFPYCEQCHRAISKLAKMWYVLRLITMWVARHPRGIWYANGRRFYYVRRLLVAWINVLKGL